MYQDMSDCKMISCVSATCWFLEPGFVKLLIYDTDEPDEVVVVQKALVEHLDMDPSVTLGVLCDQIIPPEEPMDDEELFVRDRLRSLVLSFLTREAKRAILERCNSQPDGGTEDILINTLWAVGIS
jgi:hypothetical protein